MVRFLSRVIVLNIAMADEYIAIEWAALAYSSAVEVYLERVSKASRLTPVR